MRSSGTPQRASSASSGGSTVRFGMGRVRSGKTTATRSEPSVRSSNEPPEQRAPEGGRDRRRLVVEAGLVQRRNDLGVVGDLDRRPVAPVGQLDAHGQGAGGPDPGSDSVAASTASATWSTRGRSAR